MLKKTPIFCYLLFIIFVTGCENKKETETKKTLIPLCDKIEDDLEKYQTYELSYDELYSKLESYNNECQDSLNDICIHIKTIMTIPTNKIELQETYTKKLLNSCRQERNLNQ